MQEIYPAKSNNKNRIAFVGIEVGILLLISIPVVLVLNYFRIISLPFLPQRPLLSETTKSQITAYQSQPVLYACPLDPKLCATGKQIFDTKKRRMSGFAYSQLQKGVKIKAIFDGTYAVEKTNEITTVTLTDPKQQDQAVYRFLGAAVGTGQVEVKQGDVVGETDGQSAELTDFNTATYSLFVTVTDIIAKQVLPLEPTDDGKALGF